MRTFHLKTALLAACTLLLFATASYSQDWTQWRGPNRDGIAPALSSAWPKTLKEEWKVTVGVGHSSPVVAGGKIYVFARQGEEETFALPRRRYRKRDLEIESTNFLSDARSGDCPWEGTEVYARG